LHFIASAESGLFFFGVVAVLFKYGDHVAGATAALKGAAQISTNRPNARTRVRPGKKRPDVAIGNDSAGADDHCAS